MQTANQMLSLNFRRMKSGTAAVRTRARHRPPGSGPSRCGGKGGASPLAVVALTVAFPWGLRSAENPTQEQQEASSAALSE